MKRAVLGALLLGIVSLPVVADDRPPSTRFAVAIESGDVEAIKALLAEGNKADTHIDYGENWITPLMKACWDGEKEIVEVLLAAGADVNAQAPGWGETALGQAVSRERVEIARLLIEKGAKLESRNKQVRLIEPPPPEARAGAASSEGRTRRRDDVASRR
jgi:hypothetical protein